MVCDLTGMDIANASMLDEGTAAAEAMTLALRIGQARQPQFFVAADVFAQTLDVVRTRAAPLGIEVVVGPAETLAAAADAFGVLLQYPGANGDVRDYRALASQLHARGTLIDRRGRPSRAVRSSRPLASGAPTSSSARRSASACPWATAGRTRAISPRATSSSARCRDAWSA